MADEIKGPDVRQLADEVFPQIEFPGGKGESFRIFFQSTTHAEILKHAAEETSVEICGVLVGIWGRDADGPFALVSASIRGEAAANKFAEVTFTHETWSKINTQMDNQYADRKIVGWYHTHPDFGIFLSDRDRFIQENFFSSPGQMALVIDPIRKIEGVFVWRDGKPALADHYWIGNRVQVGAPEEQAKKDKGADGTNSSATSAAAAPPAWAPLLATALQYMLVFLIGYFLAGRLNDAAIQRATVEGVAIGFLQYGLRPDLEKPLDDIRKDLAALDEQAKSLEKNDLDLVGKSDAADKADQLKSRQDDWTKLREGLVASEHRLERVEQAYCLNPEQRSLLEQLRKAVVERALREQEEAKAQMEAARQLEQKTADERKESKDAKIGKDAKSGKESSPGKSAPKKDN